MATDEQLGSDIEMFANDATTPDLDPYFTLIDGARAVAQAGALRFYTPLGSLPDAPNCGADLRDYLNAAANPVVRLAVRTLATEQLTRDDRVGAVRVDVTSDTEEQKLLVETNGTTADGESFELVLAIGDVTIERLTEES